MEGAVNYPDDIRDELPVSKVLGQHCQYDPPGKFAMVTDGWLDIEGPVSVVSAWAMNGEDCWLSEIRLFTHNQPEDVQNPEYWIATLDRGQYLKEDIRRCEIHLLDLLVLAGCVPNALRRYALVLQITRPPGTGQDCFRRLGIAHIDISHSFRPELWARRTIRLV